LKSIPKLGKNHHTLNGYRILTIQSTVGKLMECTVARTLARDLYYKKIFPTNQGWFRPEKST